MKSLICTVATAVWLLGTSAWASDAQPHAHSTAAHPAPVTQAAPALDAHTLQDIERHRGMARAHEHAAQCLAAGKSYDDCQKQLQTQCKGLALGKHCGMRHVH